ncbi:uncharacterized protein KQ657_002939 [Scheffersomyces spartinae]|uniref:RlpA-like protein double-psi beta-barrel domain-containing protein n=1 Tax=Scheffersomyces spartinae TaxID=45513 RepID=A0A9P7V5N1_9ASCO|nr:uncharacterized protein KQ657_002939 [Scheffersomyces spartinae]KAG7191668.1 hypothetical protein KQ657_002939 [Scheffersomyces spartinae]
MKFYSLLALACGLCHVGAAPIRTVLVTHTIWVTQKAAVDSTEATSVISATTPAVETATTTGGFLDNILNAASDGSNIFQVSALDVQLGVAKSSATVVTSATTTVSTSAATATTTSAIESTTVGTSTAAAAASSTSPTGSIYSGQGTFYDTGLGACGWTSTDSDYIVAIDIKTYNAHNVDSNPNHNSLCGKMIRAFYQGKSVDVKVVDACEGCKVNDLDFSPSAFQQLANESLGRIDITWEWL